MKKITTLLTIFAVLVFCYFCYAFTYTYADDSQQQQQPTWVRITQQDTWLYKNASSADGDKLFLLQYSYYAKVKEVTQNGFYYVELFDNVAGFVKILGYVPTEKVTPSTETPLSPTYPTVFSTVRLNNLILFSHPTAQSEAVCAVYQGQTLSYFGSYPTADKTWYFVRFEQSLCYVDADGVSLPAIGLHPTPVYVPTVTPEVDTTPTEPETPTTEEKDFSQWQIAIIALIALSAVVVVVVLFLPAKSKEQKPATFDATPLTNDIKQQADYDTQPRYFEDYL